MGEFLESVLSGRAASMRVVLERVPEIYADLSNGADAVAACAMIDGLPPRMIPAPHTGYGHLQYESCGRPPTDAENAIRTIASITVGELGREYEDRPHATVCRALTANGFVCCAERRLRRLQAELDSARSSAEGVRVWEIPLERQAEQGSEDHRFERGVALAPSRSRREGYTLHAVDFSTLGERLVRAPLWSDLGELTQGGSSCLRDRYGGSGVEYDPIPAHGGTVHCRGGRTWTYLGADGLAKELSAICGPPRELRVFFSVEE